MEFDLRTLQPDYLYGDLPVNITASLHNDTITRPITLQAGLKYVTVDSQVISGDGFFLQLGLNGTAPEGGITVALETDNDAVQLPPSIKIPSGSLGVAGRYGTTTRIPEDATVTITAKLPGQTKNTEITLGAWTYDAGTWSLTGPDSMHGGGGFTKQMTLNLENPVPHGGVQVSLTSDDPRMTIPQSLDLAEGATKADFSVYAGADLDGIVTITAAIDGVGSRTHQIRVLPGLQGFEDLPFLPVAGGQSFDATIRLGAVTKQDVVISLESDNPVLRVPAEITIPAGQSSVTFTGTTTQVDGFQEAVITARLGETFISDYVYIDVQ